MDDAVVYTESWNEYLEEIEELMRRLRESGFTVRPSKCEFGVKNIEFLRHDIVGGRVGLQEHNIRKIRDATKPKTKKGIRSFLGLTGYYREFIPKYATVASPLTDLTKKGQSNKIIWTDSCERAFTNLKNTLLREPILRLPDLNQRFILQTNANDWALRTMLMQEKEDEIFPVAYASKKVSVEKRGMRLWRRRD